MALINFNAIAASANLALLSFSAAQVPAGIQIAITYGKAFGLAALGYKTYDEMSNHGDLGEKIKKGAPYLIGLGLIASPTIIAKLTGMDANSPLLQLLGGWNFGM
jgi:hypothetical protein